MLPATTPVDRVVLISAKASPKMRQIHPQVSSMFKDTAWSSFSASLRRDTASTVRGEMAQFANSPDFANEHMPIMDAIMDALDAHGTVSKPALDSPELRREMLDRLLGPEPLHEALRERGASTHVHRGHAPRH